MNDKNTDGAMWPVYVMYVAMLAISLAWLGFLGWVAYELVTWVTSK